jgi:hypothetical protein
MPLLSGQSYTVPATIWKILKLFLPAPSNDRPETDMNYTAVCTFHGKILSVQQSKAKTVAKQLASRHALERLNLEPELRKLCDCASVSSGLGALRDSLPEIGSPDDENGDGGPAATAAAPGRVSPVAGIKGAGAHALVGAGATGDAPAVKLSSKQRRQRGMKVESEEDGE